MIERLPGWLRLVERGVDFAADVGTPVLGVLALAAEAREEYSLWIYPDWAGPLTELARTFSREGPDGVRYVEFPAEDHPDVPLAELY